MIEYYKRKEVAAGVGTEAHALQKCLVHISGFDNETFCGNDWSGIIYEENPKEPVNCLICKLHRESIKKSRKRFKFSEDLR